MDPVSRSEPAQASPYRHTPLQIGIACGAGSLGDLVPVGHYLQSMKIRAQMGLMEPVKPLWPAFSKTLVQQMCLRPIYIGVARGLNDYTKHAAIDAGASHNNARILATLTSGTWVTFFSATSETLQILQQNGSTFAHAMKKSYNWPAIRTRAMREYPYALVVSPELFEHATKHLLPDGTKQQRDILGGAIAGATVSVITQPLDTAGTLQSVTKKGLLDTIRDIAAIGGLPALYTGGAFRFARLIFTGMALPVCSEKVMDVFGWNNAPRS